MLERTLLVLSLIASPFVIAPQVADAAPPESASGTISGVVRHSSTDEPLAGALVLLHCTCLDADREAYTNSRGIYSFGELPPGEYTIQVLAGEASVSKIAELPGGAKFRANFSFDPEQAEVIEIIVEASPVATNSAAAMTIGMEEAKMLPVGSSTSRDFTAVVDLAPTASRDAAGLSLAGTTAAEYRIEPQAGTLTAGVLDDNRGDELERFARAHAYLPELARELAAGPRLELIVVDQSGRPINDAELFVSANQSQQRARLRTGTDGRAVINAAWDLGLAPDQGEQFAQVRVREAGIEVTARVDLRAGSTRIELPLRRAKPEAQVLALDLVLVVDTTGSMSDELDWLTAELRAVIDEALADHPNIDVRLGVVAYRDLGDEYVTRSFPLSARHDQFEAFLQQQTANGGGDMPEAVDVALAEAAGLAWRHDQQAAKLVLLVGDAPPHDENTGATFDAAKLLREAGVSIYPVASSGIDDPAELIFRTIAADSAAQYVFLTDDSGVGNPHQKPHAEDYDVETLYAALRRILAAELRGDQAGLPKSPNVEPALLQLPHPDFVLQRSLFDDAGQRELIGGPQVQFNLF